MAKKKKRLIAPKKEENKGSKIMIYVMIAAMLFSGFLYFGRTTPPEEGVEVPDMDAYSVNEIVNFSITASVKEIRTELVSKIDRPLSFEVVRSIENNSLPGLQDAILEVGNPEVYRDPYTGEGILTGTYILYRFVFDEVDENRTQLVREMMNSNLGSGSHDLMKACVGLLSINISGPGTDTVYIPCSLDTRVGDYFMVFSLVKTREGFFGGVLGFVEKRLPVGPIVEAEVMNLTGVLVQAVIESDFLPEGLSKINAREIEAISPRFIVNQTLENETLRRINKFEGVFVSHSDEKTTISFNSSHASILEILEEEGLNYSMIPGSLILTTSEDADISGIEAALGQSKITNATISRMGFVSLADQVIINGHLADIPNNDNFNALLKTDTEVGERINLSLTALQFGDQTYVMGGQEV